MSKDDLKDPLIIHTDGIDAIEPAAEPLVPAEDAKSDTKLLIAFLAMVVIGLGNKIFQVLMFQPMYNYALFANLLTTFVYIPASFAYIFPMIKLGSLITKEQQQIPKYKFAIMGLLDSMAGIMQALAVNYINNGSLVILLSQSAIPASMAISKAFLKTKYKGSQYIGAFIVIIGIIVVLLPSFIHPESSGSHVIAWSAVMMLSSVPMCLSSVYKEKALGDTDIDAVYMNGWIALFQFFAALPLLLPSAPASAITIPELPENLWNGAKCFVGINSITTGSHPDDCGTAPAFVCTYLLFNLNYNILILLILKYGSSNILWLAMTVMVPLGNVAFALPFVPKHKPLDWEDILGLVLIMVGLIGYRFYDKVSAKVKEQCRRRTSSESELAGASVSSASPYMNTPMRGTLLHTSNKRAQQHKQDVASINANAHAERRPSF